MTKNAPPSLPPSPPEAWEPLLRLARLTTRPLERFLRIQAASGILLFVAAGAALLWANSPWASSYTRLWQSPVGLRVGPFAFERSLAWFVNDGLMAIFFFVVGMEIRREIHHGELSTARRAALPVAAALGGMLAPAALYLLLAGGPATRVGWGVPMATDIAFAVGILTLLGKRVPAALRVLLLALAVIDDLGAIAVLALFYTAGISLPGVLAAAAGFGGVLILQRLGVRTKAAYVIPALVAWAGVYAAGVHPTIAGVIVGFMTPVRAWLGPEGFLVGVQRELDLLSAGDPSARSAHELAPTLRHVDAARREALSPAEALIESLHPWVAFGIMPVFALANAGVPLSLGAMNADAWRVFAAVVVGLTLGKPLGVLAVSGLALRLGVGTLPVGLTLRHLAVVGVVAGVGFTMALFIAPLAFTDPGLLDAARLGVLVASGAAALGAWLLGRFTLAEVTTRGAAETADEAESSTET